MTPELQKAYDAEIQLEGARISQNAAARAPYKHNLNGWSVPDLYAPRTPAEMLADAKNKLASREAFAKSPEGQFVQHLADMRAHLVEISIQIEAAAAARSRSWVGELRTCDVAMARAQVAARKLIEHTLDASVEISLAATALEKETAQ